MQILKAYEASTTTLRALLSHPALQRENVEGILESMREANDEAEEIDDVIQTETKLNMEGVVNEDELEKELEELIMESKREKTNADGKQIEGEKMATEDAVDFVRFPDLARENSKYAEEEVKKVNPQQRPSPEAAFS
jgi:charged multivesicular body protein 7